MKRQFIRLYFSVFVLMCTTITHAQQDAQFSHYMFNNMYTNPGYSGVEGLTRATLLHRSQWLGYQGTDEGGAPTTQLLSLSHPLKILGSPTTNSGVGFGLTHDLLGPWRIINLQGSYAYHIKLQNGGVLGAGLGLGFLSQSIDGSVLRASEDDDVIIDGIGSSVATQFKPDISIGVHYQTRKYSAGLSLRHVGKSEFDFNVNPDSIASKLARHLYLTGSYNLFLSQNLLVVPSVVVQSDLAETSFNYGAVASLNNYKYWGGITLRQSISSQEAGSASRKLSNDDIVLLIGMSFLSDNELRVGYSFDLVTRGAAAKNPTSHEIMLSYVIPVNPEDKFTPIRTPRYRKEN